MSRTLTVPAGAVSISAIQNEKLKTSDDLYFYTSDGLLMYVRSESELLLLNNIFTVSLEDRTYEV